MKNYEERITHKERFAQQLIFDGVGQGQCYPTDYDAVLEVDFKYWFGFEVKKAGKDMPWGQKLSYTRNVDVWEETGRVAFAFIAEHNVRDPKVPVMLKDCEITKYYTKGRWRQFPYPLTVNQVIDMLKRKYNITKI